MEKSQYKSQNTCINTIQIKENKQLNIQTRNKTTLIQSPLTTLSQEMRWAYSTTTPSTTRAIRYWRNYPTNLIPIRFETMQR